MRNFPAQTGPGGEPVSDSASLTSSNANDIIQEEQNAITDSGQTLIPIANPADNTQLSEAISRNAAVATFYADSGAADAYVLSALGSFKAPSVYLDGQIIRWIAGNANTGPSTVIAAGVGVKDLTAEGGAALSGGEIDTVSENVARYSLSNDRFELTRSGVTSVVDLPKNYLTGMILSNGTDAAHDIDITVGETRDTVDTLDMVLSSILTKQIDVDWAIGTNAGGFPSGLTLTADTWYSVFIVDETGGAIDAGFDTSLTAANLLADTGGSAYRRIGSVLTDGSANIIAFTQIGDRFRWVTRPEDFNNTAPGTAAVTVTLSTPDGIVTIADIGHELTDTAAVLTLISALTETDTNPTVYETNSVSNTASEGNVSLEVPTNTSSAIRFRSSLGSGLVNNKIHTAGWLDSRGKD